MSLTPKQIPEGAIRYNTDSNKMEVWIGDKWMQVAVSTPNLDGGSRGLFMGGATPSQVTPIDFITISTFGNAQDFGDRIQSVKVLISDLELVQSVVEHQPQHIHKLLIL